jgi:hypothetical protein
VSCLLRVVSLVLVVVLWVEPAASGDSPSRLTQEQSARKACLSGDYSKGVDLLSDLFVATHDPVYLYNQGRCFEQNRRYEDAIARFHEFLSVGGKKIKAADKAAADQHIADCKEMAAQERAASPPFNVPQVSIATPITGPPDHAAAPSPESAPPAVLQPLTPPASVADGQALRLSGIVFALVGVVAVGTGLLLNAKANSLADGMKTTVDGYTRESDRQTYESLSWLGYGIGAACLVTGVVLYGVGLAAKSHSSSVVSAPAVGLVQVGVLVTGVL